MRSVVSVCIFACFSITYGQDISQMLKNKYKYVYEEKGDDGRMWYRVGDTNGYGLCDESGVEILPCLHDYFVCCKNGIIIAAKTKNGEKYAGVFDSTGANLIKFGKWGISVYDNYISIKNYDRLYGIADISGKIVLDCVSSKEIYLRDDNVKFATYNIGGEKLDGFVTIGGKYGLISANPLRVLTSAKYDGIKCLYDYDKQDYSTEYVAVNIGGTDSETTCIGGEWGIINSDGKEIIKPRYTSLDIAADNLFTMCKGGKILKDKIEGGKWGLIDNKGNILMPCEYDEPIIFKSDVAMVKKEGEVKIIKNPLVDNAAVSIAANATSSNKKKLGGPAVSRYPAPDSDVDKDIPQASRKNENLFAFVVANENYPDAPVPYALNDGRMFAEYCEKALGIPKKNINMYEDATYGNIITMMDKIKSIAKAYEGDAAVIVYYAGHGFPDEKQSTAYLLPIDGSGSEITTTGYSLAHLYDELSKLPLRDAIVFLDACFSGAKREDDMLAQSRGVAIKVKNEQPKGNLLVFTAAQGDETAHQMEEKHHGLFTYFLLKGMQQLKGNANLGDLTDFVTKNVKRQSVVINNKRQTPTVIPSPAMTDTWRSNTMCSK